jgi:hypothetical protein
LCGDGEEVGLDINEFRLTRLNIIWYLTSTFLIFSPLYICPYELIFKNLCNMCRTDGTVGRTGGAVCKVSYTLAMQSNQEVVGSSPGCDPRSIRK